MNYFSELKGKKVLVVGGSKGIGKDIALAFVQLGADVIITGRNEEDLQKTTGELIEFNPNCSYLIADIQNVNQIYSMVDQAYKRLGRIDIHICCNRRIW
ncbi:SDR family NAD(P)-dependent oxidoreductase [Priestia filamentosa]|uniref:SDR family NAD(P)-dependent oxidoreductase n=1 Tax=Priestia filamentosa TaxID=1402861 RepID=UPI000A0867C1|nr:SDR family NAD(P)-dependent oxidoreductase [Priestia filamentosa]MDT3763074.1 SDR family NAD(P)-dependent oxidoreductase [Priestia filamentosa]WRU97504.1 SDR family NAD(P)-dependent oxidoreductase [Priestia filamentosa]SMF34274.1 short chain dehydrogenase [Priestia filamentosa]